MITPTHLSHQEPATGRVRAQRFICTLFPYENDNPLYCTWEIPNTSRQNIRRAIWQHEIAPSTGRHHIQLYIETTRAVSYNQLAQYLGLGLNQCHFEQSLRPEAAWDYCGEEKEDGSSRHGCPSQRIGERPRGNREQRGGGTIQRCTSNIKKLYMQLLCILTINRKKSLRSRYRTRKKKPI